MTDNTWTRQWGVLTSAASHNLYDDLIGPVHATEREAQEYAEAAERSGLRALVVRRADSAAPWRTTTGRAPIDVIREYVDTWVWKP